MSFEIHSIHGKVPAGDQYFGLFDGSHVIFRVGAANFIGHWIQGTDATEISGGERLSVDFKFTFMDHGPRPQRLHALWEFDGPVEQAINSWEAAGFSLSGADRQWNRNHPAAIHLRTRGKFATGADSSHVVIPLEQSGATTRGDIHVGEFNPLTGFGLGFALHHLEPCMSMRRPRR
jgi:hypothetical protein